MSLSSFFPIHFPLGSLWFLSLFPCVILVWFYYPENFSLALQTGSLAFLHFYVMLQLRCSLDSLEEIPVETLEASYYSSLLLLYVVFFVLMTFFLALLLVASPSQSLGQVLYTWNLLRLRFASLILGSLLVGCLGSIKDLRPLPYVPGVYPAPRFIAKARYIAWHRSSIHRHSSAFYILWLSMIGIQIVGTMLRLSNHWSWWTSSPLFVLGPLSGLLFVIWGLHFLITYLIFMTRVEKRYHLKYKARDDAVRDEVAERAKIRNNPKD